MHSQPVIEEKRMKVIPGGNQMSLIRDTEEVIKFLEFVGKKSILSETAIQNRLTACHNLFSVVNEEEDSVEYLLSNLDLLVNRFRNRNATVLPSTLKVYKSRAKSSIEDYQEWSADPFAWERAVTTKAKPSTQEKKREKIARQPRASKVASQPKARASAPAAEPVKTEGSRRVSFPIRADFSIEMTLPIDGLTLKELHRIGLFLYPYCSDIDPENPRLPSLLN